MRHWGLSLLLVFVSASILGQQVPSQKTVTANFRVADLDTSRASLLVQQQAPLSSKSSSFIETLGTSGDDSATAAQLTSDGGIVIAGYTNGVGAGGQDVLLIKTDLAGAIQWAKSAGSTGNDLAFSVRQTSDGGYIVAGQTDSFNGVGQILLTKFTSTGAFQWASTLGNASDSAAGLSVQQTADGGYIVTGFPGGAIGGLGLLKYDSAGQLQWLKRASSTNFYGQSVQQTSDGGYVVTGSIQGNVYDLALLKFDGSGNLQWSQRAGGDGYEIGNSVQQTFDGGYIVAGTTASFGAGGQDLLLLKYDSTGSLQWSRISGQAFDDIGDSVQQTSDGGYIVGAHITSTSGASGVLLQKYDGSGTLQWAKVIGIGPNAGAASVQQTLDGGYLVTASVGAGGGGSGSDVLVIRTDASGNIPGCPYWGDINDTVTTTSFPSAASAYSVDSPSFNVGSPTLIVAAAKLKRHVICK
jgi:hypothetical protein